MAFKDIQSIKKVNLKKLISIFESSNASGLLFEVDPGCEIVLYEKATGEYFSISKGSVNEDLTLEVDLGNDKQAVLVGKDS